jgi:hypothetical protein
MKIRIRPLREIKNKEELDIISCRQRGSLLQIITLTMTPSLTLARYQIANSSMRGSLLMEEILIKTISWFRQHLQDKVSSIISHNLSSK